MTAVSPAPARPGLALACRVLLWLCLGLGLAPFAWAFGFCFPRGDDFDEVTRAMFLFDLPGALYEVGREWLTWSGRYTYHFLAVFLGKAGEMRLVCGLVCAGVLGLHGVAFCGLARVAGLARRDAAPLAVLALLGLCAGAAYLPGFYLLTEALTTGLQTAAALLFFWSLCALWSAWATSPPGEVAPGVRRPARRAAILGVLAAGVYEHSALAVLTGAGLVSLLALLHARRYGTGEHRLRPFFMVTACCLAGALVSFLAPGNFVRKAARGVDAEQVRGQLAAIPADWLSALHSFAGSTLPLTALGIALLLAFLRRRGRPALARREALFLALLVPVAFCLFSLAVTFLHALSDVPLHASPKLGASFGLYAGLALGFSAFALLGALPGLPLRGGGPALVIGAGLLTLCCTSPNFQRTLVNAVNGDMAIYAEAMQGRDAWLRQVGATSPLQGKWRFGLAGEVLHPGARSRKTAPGAPLIQVCRWERPVFPVWTFGDLRDKAAAWPNPWAAWMYGVEAVAALQPAPAAAVAACAGGDALPLGLPPAARAAGLAGAWRVNAQGGPNPTFARAWLVLASERPLPKTLKLFVPSPLSRGRMAPLFLQAWLLRRLEAGAAPPPEGHASWVGRLLSFPSARWRVPGAAPYRYAFPLGPAAPLAKASGAPAPGEWPGFLFLRLGGANFLRLDSAPESG